MQKNSDTLTQLLENSKNCGAKWADAVLFKTVNLSIAQRLGKPEGIERSENIAIGLRVFAEQNGGEIGQANVSTTDPDKENLQELAQRAVAMAKLAPADKDSTLAKKELLQKTFTELDLLDDYEPTPICLREQCKEAEDAARSVKGITNSEGAEACYSRSHIALAIMGDEGINFFSHYNNSYFSVSVSVLAGSDALMERDYDFTGARHRNDLESASEVGISAANRAVTKLNPRKISSCKVPVIFDPRVSKSLVSTLTSSISGSAIARGSSFLKDSMNKKILSDNVTIIDDPHMKRGFASKPFDMEGVANKKIALVENGILKTWLLDVRTANKLGLQTTGHATRGTGSPPSPSSTNSYMQNGILSPKELMTDIKNGLYLTETFGMGINTVTGDYSQGAAGFWIENGEIVYPVSEITIAGNLKDMFLNLTPANDLKFKYATNAPTIRIESMTVAGV